MGFSIDYEFTPGQIPASGYIWVIERAKGAPYKEKITLNPRGNLPRLIRGWRPEDGPFQTHFEDLRGNPVSPTTELPSPELP
jgi:hypothetical protein